MDSSKSHESTLDELKKMTIELVDSREKLSDENQAIIFLNLFHELFRKVIYALQYGRDKQNLILSY